MTKCSCFEEETYRCYFTEFEKGRLFARTGQIVDFEDRVRYRCLGTPEREVCSCGADRTKCDFYPDVREKAKSERQALLDKMELDFYRYYITLKGLEFDCAREYQEWKREQKDE